MLTILFDGIAYGMLLFVLACGLAVTLGLMNFVNLAHGAFAMAGGYVTVVLVNRYGVPFLATLPIAFLVTAAAGLLLERTLYFRLYARSHLDQVLFSIGLVFMAVAAVDYLMGSQQQLIQLPPMAARPRHRVRHRHRHLSLLHHRRLRHSRRSRCSSSLRARVSGAGCARRSTILAWRAASVSTSAGSSPITFAVGSGLAGLGGALGAEILGLDPTFPLKFMIYFLIVVTVGGASSITGPFLAALLLGIADVAGKYYVPQFGAFVIYTLMIVVLILRPQGLFARAR